MGKPCDTLTIQAIVDINRCVIQTHGGLYSEHNGNMHNSASLEYALETIIFPLYGEDMYPTIFDKIAVLVHAIICKHVFRDGNKRTALGVCKAMLSSNGWVFSVNKAAEDFFVAIAAQSLPPPAIAQWLRQHARVTILNVYEK